MLLIGIVVLVAGTVLLATFVLLSCRRFGSQRALPLTLLLTLAVSLSIGTTVGVVMVMGLVVGMLVERGFGYGQVIFGGSLPAVLQSVAMVFFAQQLVQAEEVSQVLTQLRGMGLEVASETYSTEDIASLLSLRPAIECVMGVAALVLAYRVSQQLAPRFGLMLPPAKPFRLWRPWDELIWALIASLVLMLIGEGVLRDLGLNGLTVVLAIYATHGTAVLRFYFVRLGVSGLVQVFVFVTLLLTAGVVVLAGVGILDTWFDWRRLRATETQPEGDADGTSTL